MEDQVENTKPKWMYDPDAVPHDPVVGPWIAYRRVDLGDGQYMYAPIDADETLVQQVVDGIKESRQRKDGE